MHVLRCVHKLTHFVMYGCGDDDDDGGGSGGSSCLLAQFFSASSRSIQHL